MTDERWPPERGAHLTDPAERDLFVELVECWARLRRARSTAAGIDIVLVAGLDEALVAVDDTLFNVVTPHGPRVPSSTRRDPW